MHLDNSGKPDPNQPAPDGKPDPVTPEPRNPNPSRPPSPDVTPRPPDLPPLPDFDPVESPVVSPGDPRDPDEQR